MSPSTCLVSTSVNPAAASIRRAVCSPHMVPRPMPPAARVSHAACAGGSVKVIAAGSWSTMRPAGHRRQPFPHVAFVQPGNLGDPSAGGRRQRGHRVEQAATVTDADHQCQHAGVHHVQQPLGERRRSGRARLLGHGQPHPRQPLAARHAGRRTAQGLQKILGRPAHERIEPGRGARINSAVAKWRAPVRLSHQPPPSPHIEICRPRPASCNARCGDRSSAVAPRRTWSTAYATNLAHPGNPDGVEI